MYVKGHGPGHNVVGLDVFEEVFLTEYTCQNMKYLSLTIEKL